MNKRFVALPLVQPGDQVAILSPSTGLPEVFPWVQDLGLERLRGEFGLVPKEYPTTRKMKAPLQDRARDIMAAFADPMNKAVIASIGGEDQIQLIKHLDPVVFKANPKPFFGYSDNTHLHNYLWNLGIPSFYGGGVMTQFAMQGKMDAYTIDSIRHALFTRGEKSINPAQTFNEVGLDWSDKYALNTKRQYESNAGFIWDGTGLATGTLWGGCVESLVVQMAAGQYLPNGSDLSGAVLFFETAEDIPDHWVIQYLLIGMGERGWLEQFSAILVGRPKAWEFNKPFTKEQRESYRIQQQQTVISTVRMYNKRIPIVQNLDFGHTDPQCIIPMGRKATIDSEKQTIIFEY